MNSYALGTAVKLEVTFSDLDGMLFDPPTVALIWKKKGGSETRYDYGTDAELVRDSLGVYYAWVVPDAPGEYCYRSETTGTGQVANEDDFIVDESCFA